MAVPLPGRSWRDRQGRIFGLGDAGPRSAWSVTLAMVTSFSSARTQILARPADPLAISTSYSVMRGGIGVLGLAFPLVIVVGGGLDNLQGSLSAYYHYSPLDPTRYGAGTMRDIFVGMLCAIGAFLFFYRGHSLQEDVALNIAGISAVLVAFFPMDWPTDAAAAGSTSAALHSVCATIFFVMVAYDCVFRARDTLCLMDDAKRRRKFERLYLVLGILMVSTPASVALLRQISAVVPTGYTTLLIEIAGVLVFASFWLVKSIEIRESIRGRLDGRPEMIPLQAGGTRTMSLKADFQEKSRQ